MENAGVELSPAPCGSRLKQAPIWNKIREGLEKAMAPHSSTFAWKIPWTEEPGSCSPWAREESDTTERLHFDFSLSCIGEGNGNPLQCSCLENPRDGGACWAAVCGVAQSRTRLKQLSSNSKGKTPELNVKDVENVLILHGP